MMTLLLILLATVLYLVVVAAGRFWAWLLRERPSRGQ
jgi:hypothetical protein